MVITDVTQKMTLPNGPALVQKVPSVAKVSVMPIRYEGRLFQSACVIEYNDGAYLTFLDAQRLDLLVQALNRFLPSNYKWQKVPPVKPVDPVKDKAKRINVTERYNAHTRLRNLAESFRQSGNPLAADKIEADANIIYNGGV